MSRVIPHKKRLSIARDIHFSSLTNEEIHEKYNIKGTFYIGKHIPPAAAFLPKPQFLLKVEPGNYNAAIRILRDEGIAVEEVAENFELLEYYDSKISPENNEVL